MWTSSFSKNIKRKFAVTYNFFLCFRRLFVLIQVVWVLLHVPWYRLYEPAWFSGIHLKFLRSLHYCPCTISIKFFSTSLYDILKSTMSPGISATPPQVLAIELLFFCPVECLFYHCPHLSYFPKHGSDFTGTLYVTCLHKKRK